MKSKLDYVWPFVGLSAVGFSIWLLSRDLKDVSWHDVLGAIEARGIGALGLCVASLVLAYAALAWYDRIAMMHVRRVVSWPVVTVVSFVAYALSHNIGVAAISAGIVRYRAYSRMSLTLGETAIITAFCAFTFTYGALFLGGMVLVGEPTVFARLYDIPTIFSFMIGVAMLMAVLGYQIGAVLNLPPLVIRGFRIEYPRAGIAFRQLFVAPIEIIGAAGIIYFALPETGNPGYFVVLGVFLAAFCAGLISNAPGGIGVFEFVFIKAMPDMPKTEVLAALIVFRILYLLIPLVLSCIVVVLFERKALMEAIAAFMIRVGLRKPA